MQPPVDIFDYFLQEANKVGEIPPDSPVHAFITFCRGVLARNQPVGIDPLQRGMGIRFQDMTVVPFVPDTDEPQPMGMAMGISKQVTSFKQDGIEPSFSHAVTTGELARVSTRAVDPTKS